VDNSQIQQGFATISIV